MPEWEFLAEVAILTGCAILLDVNNIYVNAMNHGFDPARYLRAIPVEAVQEIHPPVLELPYLADVARLEWLVDVSFYAAEHASLDVARLAEVPEDAYGALGFTLHPACRLLGSHYPVSRIWRVNQADWAGDASVDLAQGPDTLLVRRDRYAVLVQPLQRGEFAMLNLLAAGRSFAHAYEWAAGIQADFDVMAFLRSHISAGTLVHFQVANGEAVRA
jgi:hypothetical protein